MIEWLLKQLGVVLAPDWDDIEFTSADKDNVG
jgi:hypothetical protein